MDDSTRVHTVTNEMVRAVLAGLEPNSDDTILSVCGSGDIPFALLEYAEVVAVDILPQQIIYAQNRRILLEGGDIARFLDVGDKQLTDIEEKALAHRNSYFKEGNRLERIRSRLDKLTFVQGDYFTVPIVSKRFSKAYLSNILGFDSVDFSVYCGQLQRIAEHLRNPALMYITENGTIEQGRRGAILFVGKFGNPENWLSRLRLDDRLTKNAKAQEELWNPAVYRFLVE